MSSTSIRLSEELKLRVTLAAEREGKSPHSFILEAIAEKTLAEERRAEFETLARQRLARIAASGETISWQEMRVYLEARLTGDSASLPTARKLAR